MRKNILFCAVLLGAAMTTVAAEPAGPVEINLAETRCNVTRGTGILAELGGRDAFQLNFDPAQTKAADFTFAPLRINQSDRNLKIRLEVYLAEGKSPTEIHLLLMDRDGEIIPFAQTLPAGKTGWIALEYKIDPAKTFSRSWGSRKADRKLDFPIRAFEIICHYKQPGYIGFGKLSVSAPEEK